MRAMILACASLAEHVAAAQKAAGTRPPVRFLDRRMHVDPPRLGRVIAAELPTDIDRIRAHRGEATGQASWTEEPF